MSHKFFMFILGALLLGSALFVSFTNAFAQNTEVTVITDSKILTMIDNGQNPEVSSSSTSAVTSFWFRTLWDIGSLNQNPNEVWVAMTSDPAEQVSLTTYIGSTATPQQLSVTSSFQQWQFPRTTAQQTNGITAEGHHGWVKTTWNSSACQDGPYLTLMQTDSTWMFVQNRTAGTLVYKYLAPNQEWRTLPTNSYEGYRIYSLEYGKVLIRTSTDSTIDCATIEWDWNPVEVSVPTKSTFEGIGTIEVPILVNTDVTGKDIISFQFDLQYDPAVLSPTYIRASIDSLAFRANYQIEASALQAGNYRVSGWSSHPIFGKGTLFLIGFTINGKVDTSTELKVQNFLFNEGNPPVVIANGSISIVPIPVHVKTSYTLNGLPVVNTRVFLQGDNTVEGYTGQDGWVKLEASRVGNYKLIAVKDGDTQGAVTAFDAARVARCVLQLQSCYLQSADTDRNGQVQAYDAALIAQYVVGIVKVGNFTGQWLAEPSEIILNNLVVSTTQYVNMTLIGDVTGNWVSQLSAAAITSSPTLSYQYKGESVQLTVSDKEAFSALELNVELPQGVELVSAVSNDMSVVTGNGKIIAYGAQPTNEVEINLTFRSNGQNEVKLNLNMVDESPSDTQIVILLGQPAIPPTGEHLVLLPLINK